MMNKENEAFRMSFETQMKRDNIKLKERIGELEKFISEREQIESEVIESEERLKILFEYAPDAYYLNDMKGRIVDGNRAAEDLVGYKRDELIGRSLLTKLFFSPSEISRVAAVLAKNTLGKATGPDEFVLKRKDGTSVVVEVRTFPVRIKNKKYVLGIARDITRRKRAEEGLRESERRYRALFEQANDAIFHLDQNGFHISANKKAAKMLGYSVEELKKLSLKDIVAPSELLNARQKFHEVWSGEIYRPYERIFRKKDGAQFPVEINVAPICDSKGKPMFLQSIVRDITERKEAEAALTESRKELQRLNAYLNTAREEERALFANEMHDDIGQSLTALKMDLARLDRNLPQEDRSTSDIIRSMESLINQMIHDVRRMYMELRPSQLDELGLVAALEWQVEEFRKRTGIDCSFHSDREDIPLPQDLLTTVFRISQELLNDIAWMEEAMRVKVGMRIVEGCCELEIKDNWNKTPNDGNSSFQPRTLTGIRERVDYLGGELQVRKNGRSGASVRIRIPLDNR